VDEDATLKTSCIDFKNSVHWGYEDKPKNIGYSCLILMRIAAVVVLAMQVRSICIDTVSKQRQQVEGLFRGDKLMAQRPTSWVSGVYQPTSCTTSSCPVHQTRTCWPTSCQLVGQLVHIVV
jgi:hypothetical protein